MCPPHWGATEAGAFDPWEPLFALLGFTLDCFALLCYAFHVFGHIALLCYTLLGFALLCFVLLSVHNTRTRDEPDKQLQNHIKGKEMMVWTGLDWTGPGPGQDWTWAELDCTGPKFTRIHH